METFARNELYWGKEAQKKIKNSNIAKTPQKPNVVQIICPNADFDINGAFLPKVRSCKYSLRGASPPKANEFKLSITILIINI